MKVETFQSEISMNDLEDQIQKFLRDNNYEEVERRTSSHNFSGFIDYTAQVQYQEYISLIDVVEEIERNFKYVN